MLGLIILTIIVVNGWYLIEGYSLSRRLAKSGQRIGNATIREAYPQAQIAGH